MDSAVQNDDYTVELNFDPNDPSACDGVRSFLKGFRNLTPVRIEAALETGKLVLKRNVGFQEANAIRERVRIVGTRCDLKKHLCVRSETTGIRQRDMTGKKAVEVVSKDIVCPKCKTKQHDSIECRQCGVIISKTQDLPVRSVRKDANDRAIIGERQLPSNSAPKSLVGKWLPMAKKQAVRIGRWSRNVNQLSKRPFSALIDCGALFLSALFLEMVLLYIGNYLWYMLSSTQAGEYYAQRHPDETALINSMLGSGVLEFSLHVVFWVLVINLLLGFFTQFTHLARFYLDSDGIAVRLIWGCSSAVLSAWCIYTRSFCPSLLLSYVAVLPPTFCLLKCCMNFAKTLLPEFGSIIARVVDDKLDWGKIVTGINKKWRS